MENNSKQPKTQFDINENNLLNQQVFFDIQKAKSNIVGGFVKDKELPRYQTLIQLEDRFKNEYDKTLENIFSELEISMNKL